MSNRKSLGKKFESLTYNHIWLRYAMDYGTAFAMSVLSALIFAFGMNCFIAPNAIDVGGTTYTFSRIISGGASGIAQTFAHIFDLTNVTLPSGMPSLYSIFYFAINIPLIILAFKGIGVRFGAFTLVNVGFVFLFTNIFKGEFFSAIALFFDANGGIMSRALFAGICTGLSSAIAYKFETSAGGLDIVFYYISLRKNTTAGKYGALINVFVMLAYSTITAVGGQEHIIYIANDLPFTLRSFEYAISMMFFSVVYLFTVTLLIDFINTRNKKVQIQIITSVKQMPTLLLANIPHGATIVQAKGAFSGDDRFIIYMVVSSIEVKHVIRLIRDIDKNSFVNVTSLQQVYGRFFQKPIK